MDRRALHKQFLQQFPIEYLENMTLEEYTNLNREDSFCYWLEVKTQELGSIWGGSSYKFGIYRYEKRPDNPTVVVSDDEYAWYKKYNASNKEEAFKVVFTAEESAKNMELGTDATERMMSLNDAISEIDGFSSSFHIGAAYFKGVDDFDALWELKLAGLLKEYLRGMPDAEESLEALKKAYYLSNE